MRLLGFTTLHDSRRFFLYCERWRRQPPTRAPYLRARRGKGPSLALAFQRAQKIWTEISQSSDGNRLGLAPSLGPSLGSIFAAGALGVDSCLCGCCRGVLSISAPCIFSNRARPSPTRRLRAKGLKRRRQGCAGGATPARTALIEDNKRMLKALSQRYPGQLELRAPLGATPLNLRMQAQTAARYEDILAHVTLTGAGSRDSRLLPIWDQTRVWDPGD